MAEFDSRSPYYLSPVVFYPNDCGDGPPRGSAGSRRASAKGRAAAAQSPVAVLQKEKEKIIVKNSGKFWD